MALVEESVQPREAIAVDVHTHVVPATFPQSLHGAAGWPTMEPVDACHRHILIDGKVYRTLSDQCWDAPRRLGDMHDMGIAVQAISPMPELFSYWLPAAAADDLLRYTNDVLAEMIAASSGRMVGLAALPLQDMDRALRELHRTRVELGFAGVEIGSNVNGTPIGSPVFDSLFAEAERLGAAVFVHAVRPAGMDRLVGPPALQQVLAYPTDVGLAAASVITANTLVRFPRLRLAFSHGGGTLQALLPRLAEGARVFPALRDALLEDVYAQARRCFYDTLVYDTPTLRHLLTTFGRERLLVGTDYPFNFHERQPIQRVLDAFKDQETRKSLLETNARTFLGLGVAR